jgi:hypothetical protein
MAEDDLLDGLFAEASGRRAPLSDGLMARIQADADAHQPRPRPAPVAIGKAAGGSWFGTLADWFGGGIALAGMSAAAVSGLYLGLAQPAALLSLSEAVTGGTVESVELLPDLASNWAME